uniref:General transcription factor IIF subunit 2 n=1 Tax=Cyprinus carpio TaxID=7962 RepID=A0A8C2IF84_CYPCA
SLRHFHSELLLLDKIRVHSSSEKVHPLLSSHIRIYQHVEYEKRKKEEAKCARADKQKVLEVLFSAFEKHQYYNIRDLMDITKQPLIYLKEILWEIGVYNSRGPHKSTWELKPE